VERLKGEMKFIGTDPERYSVSVPKSLEKVLVTRAAQEMITVEELLTELIQHKINWPSTFEYEVLPENQCQGLKIHAKEQGHNEFWGFIQYSECFGNFYLTTDGITYTDLDHAFNVNPIEWIEKKKK